MADTTTIRVSRRTLETLERLRGKLAVESLDEAIQSLLKKQRKIIIDNAFGLDQSKMKSFTEGDRGEDRC
jgi:hypothetical protein